MICLIPEAVYSDQYTGSDQDKSKRRYIQRLPFFTLVKRVYDERDETNEKLNQQLEQVKEKWVSRILCCEDLDVCWILLLARVETSTEFTTRVPDTHYPTGTRVLVTVNLVSD